MSAQLVRYGGGVVVLLMSASEHRQLCKIAKHGYDALLRNNTAGQIQRDLGTPSQVSSTRTVYKALSAGKAQEEGSSTV